MIEVKKRCITTGDGTFSPGQSPTGLSESEVERLKGQGLLNVYQPEKKATPPDKKPTLKEVVSAISKLIPDNEDHWTTSGKPQTGALSEVVGKDVNAELRDRAFSAWKEKQGAAAAEEAKSES